MSKLIKNKVKKAEKVSVDEFLSWEFNDLKEAQGRDVTELVNSITRYGFAAPVFIWKNDQDDVYVLDGTGRSLAVTQMIADGFEFQSIPFVEIEAETKEQAMELVPTYASSYGETTRESMIKFSKGLNLQFDSIKIPGISQLVLEGEAFNYKDKNKEIVLDNNSGNGKGRNSSGGGHGGMNEDGFKTCPQCGYELSDDE
jgi:hypothetical protein